MISDGYSPPATPIPTIGTFREKWADLKRHDDAREELMMELETLHTRQERSILSLERDKERIEAHEELLLIKVKRLELENRDLQERMDRAPFVVLLVDGDNTLFLDKFVQAGLEGGHEAAQSLKRSVEQYLIAQDIGFQHHWKIMVHVYANLHGLADTYARSRVTQDNQVPRKFFTGFNRELVFFEFVDAGNDKEAADKKIEQYLDHYHESANCKHVLLAGSGDRSYVTHLRQYSADPANITLVESVPFEPSFRSLSQRFQVTSFSEVFKTTKLEVSATPVPVKTTSNTYSGITSSVAPPKISAVPVSAIRRQSTTGGSPPTSVRKVLVNSNSERVDEPLSRVNMNIVNQFRSIADESQRPCGRHYLTTCHNGPNCRFNHTRRYNSEEMNAIRYLARNIPCGRRLNCADLDCTAGHVCPKGSCNSHPNCNFGPEMHDVDQTVDRELLIG